MGKRLLLAVFIIQASICFPASRNVGVERVLNIAVNINLPPYQYLDGDSIAGIHIAILDRIALDKGYQVKYFAKNDDHGCLAALAKGEVDAIVGITSNEAGDRGFYFSDIMTSSSLCMVVRTDRMVKHQLEGVPFPLSAAMELGTTPYSMIANLGIAHYRVHGDQRSVFESLEGSTVDAAVAVKDSIVYQIERAGGDKRFTMTHNYLGYVSYGLAVRADDAELLRILNDGISAIRAGSGYEAIMRKWIVADDGGDARAILAWVGLVAALASVLAGVYVYLSLRIRKAMKRNVDMQTREIQEANRKLERQITQINDENELRNRIIKYSPSAMAMIDKDGRVSLMNRSAQLLTGVDGPGGSLGVRDLPIFKEIIERIAPRPFEPGTTIENERLMIGARSYRCTMHQIIHFGDVVGVLITVQDVTKEEQKAQAEFEIEKNRTLNRLVAGIAHEIRNPLMSIRTFATVMGSQGDDKEVQRSFSKYVPDEVDRINRLIENMIQYAKPVRRQARPCDAGEIIRECVGLLSPSIRAKSVSLSVSADDDASIFVDRDQIKQVLINLLINGVEAIEKKLSQTGEAAELRLAVTARTRPESVVIEIQDDGAGMSEQELARCLDPFYTTKATGTGLGLALCKQYLSENSARLSIQSEENQYTRISVAFPRSSRETADIDNR
ncbi:MAG: transporter substrate-binding domain-containing protein [Spirochaetes bacterium]|nr:transporter substrate-binding domain-containing protein [Spirochaetota bacterium]MBU1082370.1 transporter substrate-binding domain-containing protein [Spirochaetota bacterium]